MGIQILLKVLGWSIVFNIVLLILWSLILVYGKNLLLNLHRKFWPELTSESIIKIHYAGIVFHKLTIFTFFIMPYLAFRLLGY